MSDLPDTSFNAAVIEEFRTSGGKVGGPWEGASMLLLTTTGARTGKPRVSPLMYFRSDDELLIVGSYAGADVHPAWVHNLHAESRAHIEIGTESYDVRVSELPPGDRTQAWAHIIETAPGFAQYQSRTTRTIPVFKLVRI